MTTRRSILRGAASLVAPADFDVCNALDFSATKSPFKALIREYRRMRDQLEVLFAARNRIEADASARKIKFRDCAELAVVEEKERAWYDAEKMLIQRAARTRANTLDEVMQKLILWRLVDFDREGFDNPVDMVAFSAYRDLLFLTGRASPTPKTDAKSLAIIWNDQEVQEDVKDECDNGNNTQHGADIRR